MLILKLFILLMYEVLEPLQTYFLDRAMNPRNYPKHIGIRITQDDPPSYDERLEDNSRCSRAVLKENSKTLLPLSRDPDTKSPLSTNPQKLPKARPYSGKAVRFPRHEIFSGGNTQ